MNTPKTPVLSRPLGSRLGGLLFILAFLPSFSEAQCPQGWDTSGSWGLKQSNQAAPNSLVLSKGSNFTGQASYPSGPRTVEGSVKGSVTGNNVHLEIAWSNGLTGIYDGIVNAQGKINGTGYEKRSPGTKVSWFSDRLMKCGPVQSAPTSSVSFSAGSEVQIPAGERIGTTFLKWNAGGRSDIKITVRVNNGPEKSPFTTQYNFPSQAGVSALVEPGENVFTLSSAGQPLAKATVTARMSTSAPSVPSAPPAPPATAQKITASPTVVTIPPGQASGTTTLTWDAGKDHPYAEVWVKVDDDDEKQIVEQGKGSRRVIVRPGETHLYILTDAGQRLSTVTVTTK